MNKIDLDEYKLKYSEILRERAGHDEAQAIHNAEKRRDEHWQGVVAEKDAENEKLQQMIASLQASKKGQGQD